MRFLFPMLIAAFFSGQLKAQDALDQVNAQRAARGLPAFLPDPQLSAAAHAAAQYRATYRLFGHTTSDFSFLPAGARADAAGCAAYPASYGFMACCTYENYQYAGAASVTGADGRVYHHLFVRGGTGGSLQVQSRSDYRVINGPFQTRAVERHRLLIRRR